MSVMADQLTRVEVEEALAEHRRTDRNVIHIVGSTTHPTAWDVAHARYNRLLSEWETAKEASC